MSMLTISQAPLPAGTAVIFVAAISEYDQVLAEDGRTNRMLESINLFTEIMNSEWFTRTPLVTARARGEATWGVADCVCGTRVVRLQ